MKRLFRINIFLIILCFLMMLISCSKPDFIVAYCFSIIFGQDANSSEITLYCKTSDNSNENNMEQITFNFKGKNYAECFKKAEKASHNIYYNSVCAYYISDNVSNEIRAEIPKLLLDNVKFKTDNYFYSSDGTDFDIRLSAKEVCKSECIPKNVQQNFSNTIKYLRNIQ